MTGERVPLARLAAGTAINTAVFAALLFAPAGHLGWWRAWALMGALTAGSVIMSAWLYRHDPALLRERLRSPIQPGQPRVDQVVLLGFVVAFMAWTAFVPLDVFRLHLLGRPGPAASSAGMGLVVLALWLIHLTLRENSFAAPVVKHQRERDHRVIDTGVYGAVRHPMYAALVLLMEGMALWLESWAAALLAVVPASALLARIFVEERFLARELPGYPAYMHRVRYRLVPFLW